MGCFTALAIDEGGGSVRLRRLCDVDARLRGHDGEGRLAVFAPIGINEMADFTALHPSYIWFKPQDRGASAHPQRPDRPAGCPC